MQIDPDSNNRGDELLAGVYNAHSAKGSHPDSTFRSATDREVQLKVHRCLWSGDYPENSLSAIEECLRAPVARAEIDLGMLQDSDFLVAHPGIDFGHGPTGRSFVRNTTRQAATQLRLLWQGEVSAYRPPLLSEAVATIASIAAPTLIELDMIDFAPFPWARAEELVQLVQPVKQRVIFNGPDWNLRRLLAIDSSLLIGFNPAPYLDWVPENDEKGKAWPLPRGAYGYLDRHPLALHRLTPIEDYLSDRLGGILRLVPGIREVHLRLSAFERMLEDGVTHAANFFHREGMVLDVWTLDAGMPSWRERLARVVAAGVDIVTTNTPREVARTGRTLE